MPSYKILETLGKEIKVINTLEPHPAVGDMVNAMRRNKNKGKKRVTKRLDTMVMDIGRGKKSGPGGKPYTLMLLTKQPAIAGCMG